MKTVPIEPVRLRHLLCIAYWMVTACALGQTQPQLVLDIASGRLIVSLTGEPGRVYSLECATEISSSDSWVHRTLVQAQPSAFAWTDPSAFSQGQRFYRAISVAAPADANLVFIQPGTFTMGSPTNEVDRDMDETWHTVNISRGFWMEKYEVTQMEYLAVMGWNPSYHTPDHGYSDDLTRPVEMVNWFDATNYCALRTQQERARGVIPTNYVYRLPTESEWEYACRAGTTRFYYGDDPDYTDLVYYAWYNANSDGMTHPVGQLLPNAWGLCDMIGNVAEWCQDFYAPYPAGSVTDPQGAVSGSRRTIRSTDFRYGINNGARSAARGSFQDYYFRRDDFGFRVVLAQVHP